MKIIINSAYTRSLVNLRGELIRHLTSNGHEVLAIAPEHDRKLIDSLEERGARFRVVKLKRTSISPIADIAYIRQMQAILATEKPDLFLSYNIKPIIFGSIAARLSNVPIIASIVAGLGYAFSTPIGLKHNALAMTTRILFGRAISRHKLMVFQNHDDLRDLKACNLLNPKTRCIVVGGSGVDTNWFQYTEPPTDTIKFLLTARLLADKGVHEYYEAAKKVLSTGRKAVFQLLGPFDSNPKGITKSTVDRWEAEGIIDYLGELDDVRPAYNNCSVFVLPSYYREGCPRSSLEALSCGRPVITTDSVGCRETVIDGKNGFLVKPQSIDEIEQAMIRLIDEPALIHQMGIASRQLAVKRFDVHTVNQQIVEAIEALP